MSRGRRIKLDLSDFVQDAGARRWMFIKEESFSTISDVVEKLREEYQQLGENDLVSLMLDNFSLPPWETVELLQSGDLIKVTRSQPRSSETQAQRVEKVPPQADDRRAVGKTVKRTLPVGPERRRESSSSSSSSESSSSSAVSKPQVKPKIPAAVKRKAETSSSSESSSDSSSDSEDPGKKIKVVSEKEKSSVKPQESSTESSDDTDSDEKDKSAKAESTKPEARADLRPGSVSAKPRRKRKRKNKNKNKLSPDEVPVFEAEILPPSSLLNTDRKTNVNTRRTFDESNLMDLDESHDTKQSEEFTEEDVRKLYERSVSSKKPNPPSHSVAPSEGGGCEAALIKEFDEKKVTNNSVVSRTAPNIVFKPRVLSVKEMSLKSTRKEPLNFSNGSQIHQGNSGTPVTKETEEKENLSQFSALLNCNGKVFDRIEPPVRDYTALQPVRESGPRVGDIIAFKHIEMSENYTPELSDFKEGKVLEVDENKSVVLEMITKSKVRKTGRFEIEDFETSEEERQKSFSWSELIEPRLVFP